MSELLKNRFDSALVQLMRRVLERSGEAFHGDVFEQNALVGLDKLEMKARSNQISAALGQALPKDFATACNIVKQSLHPKQVIPSQRESDKDGLRGWAIMPMSDWVARVGLEKSERFDLSMEMLRELTMRWSAEFAIRPFLIAEPERTLAVMKIWARDESEHVRRLASEGSRPRLPWGIQLKSFVADPTPLLSLLESLKDDPSEYVRRSVANHLNDIAKDHPEIVIKIAKRWMQKATRNRERMVRHACRTLIKNGDKSVLRIFGYQEPCLSHSRFMLDAKVIMGDVLNFQFEIEAGNSSEQKLMIDYGIHHLKANGSTTVKIFKWKTLDLSASVSLRGTHSFRKITTRRYYAGEHFLEIFVNGVSFAKKPFLLK